MLTILDVKRKQSKQFLLYLLGNEKKTVQLLDTSANGHIWLKNVQKL